MAKSKQTESKAASSPAAKKKSPAKTGKTPPSQNLLGIDTGLVAQAAAMAVGNKGLLHESQADTTPTDKKESSTFKHLKESLNKPGGAALNQFLHNTALPAAKKSNLPFSGGGKQIGHNQTFGADVTRSGVPRRTPG